MRLLKHHKRPSSRQNGILSSVISEDRFSVLMERERSRTHRNGFSFSLLVFQVEQQDSGQKAFETLLKFLRGRLRTVDDIGWYRANAMGVLLPDTNAAGAEILATEIMENVDRYVFSLEIQVYPRRKKPDHPVENRKRIPLYVVEGERRQTEPIRERQGDYCIPSGECCPVHLMPMWKRALDLTGSLLGLIILFPVMLIISIYIKLVSPGPIFFKQTRIGYLGQPFTIWKFRTMHVRAETDCHQAHLKDLIQNDNP